MQNVPIILAQAKPNLSQSEKSEIGEGLVWSMIYIGIALALITAGGVAIYKLRAWMKEEGMI